MPSFPGFAWPTEAGKPEFWMWLRFHRSGVPERDLEGRSGGALWGGMGLLLATWLGAFAFSVAAVAEVLVFWPWPLGLWQTEYRASPCWWHCSSTSLPTPLIFGCVMSGELHVLTDAFFAWMKREVNASCSTLVCVCVCVCAALVSSCPFLF